MSTMSDAVERLAVLTWERAKTYDSEWRRAGSEFFGMSRLALYMRDDEAQSIAYLLSDICDQYAIEVRHAA